MGIQIGTVYQNEWVEDVLFPGIPSGETYVIPDYSPSWNSSQATFNKPINPTEFTAMYMAPNAPPNPYPGMVWVDTDAI